LASPLDEYLRIGEIEDYGPQGLQVESAAEQIERIALQTRFLDFPTGLQLPGRWNAVEAAAAQGRNPTEARRI
jgi:hypothetical protein